MLDILPYRADYYPVLGQIMKEMDVAGTINRIVNAGDSQAKIDAGTFVCLMVHNLLGDVNIRLYTMDDFFEDKALPLLVPWDPDIDIDDINDDRAARVLDAMWDADPQKVFSAVSNEAIRLHDLDTSVIHGDTTSKSFQGVFDNTDGSELAPVVTFGHSKDHRPDLKQLVFGVGTTADGVPVIAEVTDGNESDKTLNGRWVKNLRSVLGKDIPEFLLYVADSALVTTPNLRLMDKYHIDFISRLPGTFSIEDELKRKALCDDNWESIGKLSEEKKAATYQSCEVTGKIDGKKYRFVVIQSDKKDKRKLKSLNRSVKREHAALTKTLEELKKRPFACKRDAEIEAEKFLKEYGMKSHITDWEIEEKTEKVKREKRGRPKNGEKIQTSTNYYLNGSLRLDDDAYEIERDVCGLFVLITSLMDVKKRSSKDILQRYKGQGNVERIFKFIKNPSWVGSFCLKKPERIAALGYLVLIAAMIYTLWERRVRKALSDSGIAPVEGLNRQKTRKPTAFALQKVMSSIMVLSKITDGRMSVWLPKPLKFNQKRILELSGFSDEIYRFAP
ncbi:MAG: IS1634 family transposase [Candidatus Thermoplasmatota archaeon]|nr:IS1634 family transposase [Candidatus Thermoplasmatota archaeon]